MNCRTTLQSSIRFSTKPNYINKHQQKEKAEQSPRHSTAYTAKRQGGVRCCSQFFMSWFLQPTHLHYFIFCK